MSLGYKFSKWGRRKEIGTCGRGSGIWDGSRQVARRLQGLGICEFVREP